MHIKIKPTVLGNPLSENLAKFIHNLPIKMIETYREENELVEAEAQLRNKAILERETKLQEDEDEDMEALMDDDSEIELETGDDSYPEGYDY
jgi:CO dehydrogenase/acetyl-CoA synthase epsilon subunit